MKSTAQVKTWMAINLKISREQPCYEDLTGLRARLFAFARDHANVDKATTSDSGILCFFKSQTERGYPVTIETVDDLFKLGENSVNYKDFGLDNFLLTA